MYSNTTKTTWSVYCLEPTFCLTQFSERLQHLPFILTYTEKPAATPPLYPIQCRPLPSADIFRQLLKAEMYFFLGIKGTSLGFQLKLALFYMSDTWVCWAHLYFSCPPLWYHPQEASEHWSTKDIKLIFRLFSSEFLLKRFVFYVFGWHVSSLACSKNAYCGKMLSSDGAAFHNWSFSLLQRCGSLACFPPPVDAGEGSARWDRGAIWRSCWVSETLLHINDNCLQQ